MQPELQTVQHRLLRASAGTGKTYQLAQAYVQFVTQAKLRPRQMVAITFTRKAAAELRARIRQHLVAAQVAPDLLLELSAAPITNFHGFCLQLLKSWGPTAGGVAYAELLGEPGDDALLFFKACERAWFATEPDDAQVPSEVVFAIKLLAPYFQLDTELPRALWGAMGRAREDLQPIEKALLGSYDVTHMQQTMHTKLMHFRQSFMMHTHLTGKSRQKLQAFLQAPYPKPNDAWMLWHTMWQQAYAHLDRKGNLRHIFTQEEQQNVYNGLEAVAAEACCQKLVSAMATLVEHAWRAYVESKESQQVMDFSDVIEKVVDLLLHKPALHADMRERYQAVLVDEAQDTNRLQRQLVHLLAGLQGPHANQSKAAALFVVGDWKQSIYTFRGADPQSFELFAADLQARGGTSEQLMYSRRSQPTLVEGINHLGRALFQDAYECLASLDVGLSASTKTLSGMLWYELPKATNAAAELLQEATCLASILAKAIQEGAQPADFAVLMATMTTAPVLMQALAAQNIPAVLGGGGSLFEQPEVCDVLALLSWLLNADDRLSASIALRSPLFGITDNTLYRLLQPLPGSTHDLLWALRNGQLAALQNLAKTDVALAEAQKHVAALIVAASCLGAHTMLQYLDACLQWQAVYVGLPDGEQKLANLQRLCELANLCDLQQGFSVARFVAYCAQRSDHGQTEPIAVIPRGGAGGAVVLSSVHQSKGLQYRQVVLAGLCRKGRNDTASVRYGRNQGLVFRPKTSQGFLRSWRWQQAHQTACQDDAAELCRLLYVAVTRAQERVIFLGPKMGEIRQEGFAGLLTPWAPQAQAAGVLQTLAWEPNSDLQHVVQPAAKASPPAILSAPTQAPDYTCFDVAVTQLVDHEPNRLLLSKHQGLWPRPKEQYLDPQTRGVLAHAVLAQLAEYDPAADGKAFIRGQLRRLGYDPQAPYLIALQADLLAFLTSELGQTLCAIPAAHRRHELPFVLHVDVAPYTALLRGQIDLLYASEQGPVVVDFKHAYAQTTDVQPYLAQLEAYAWAVSRLCCTNAPIKTQLIFLRNRQAPLTHWVGPEQYGALHNRLHILTQSLCNVP